MSLTFRCLSATTLPVHGAVLKPETFASMTPKEAAHSTIGVGNSTVPLGDLFRIDGEVGDEKLTLEGDFSHVHAIGQGMIRGTLEIRGPAGPMLGSRMSGGTLDVHGTAGHWTGAEMAGGLIRIRGDVGDFTGAAYPGSRLGMKDGAIYIEGSAGEDVGLSMRRGLVVILGDAGDGLGRDMIAGTIILGGTPGRGIGAGMKRGSLVLLKPEADPEGVLPPTFIRAGRFPAGFLVVYKRQLDAWGLTLPVAESVLSAPCERYNGDTLNGGQGEILLCSPDC